MNENLVVDSDETVAPIGGVVRGGDGQKFLIGFVDEVNGRGALAVPEFVPSRNELLVLLKYWYEVSLDISFIWHVYSQMGSCDMRQRRFAHLRIDRIIDALHDDEAVQKAFEEVNAEFSKKKDDLAWRTFIGTASPEEVSQFRAQMDAAMTGETEDDREA